MKINSTLEEIIEHLSYVNASLCFIDKCLCFFFFFVSKFAYSYAEPFTVMQKLRLLFIDVLSLG